MPFVGAVALVGRSTPARRRVGRGRGRAGGSRPPGLGLTRGAGGPGDGRAAGDQPGRRRGTFGRRRGKAAGEMKKGRAVRTRRPRPASERKSSEGRQSHAERSGGGQGSGDQRSRGRAGGRRPRPSRATTREVRTAMRGSAELLRRRSVAMKRSRVVFTFELRFERKISKQTVWGHARREPERSSGENTVASGAIRAGIRRVVGWVMRVTRACLRAVAGRR